MIDTRKNTLVKGVYSLMTLGILSGVLLFITGGFVSWRTLAKQKVDAEAREEFIETHANVRGALQAVSALLESSSVSSRDLLRAQELLDSAAVGGGGQPGVSARSMRRAILPLRDQLHEFTATFEELEAKRASVERSVTSCRAAFVSAFNLIEELYGLYRLDSRLPKKSADLDAYRKVQIELVAAMRMLHALPQAMSVAELIGCRENEFRPTLNRVCRMLERIGGHHPTRREAVKQMSCELQDLLGSAADAPSLASPENGDDPFSRVFALIDARAQHESIRGRLRTARVAARDQINAAMLAMRPTPLFSVWDLSLLVFVIVASGLAYVLSAIVTHRHLTRAQAQLVDSSDELRVMNDQLKSEIRSREETERQLRKLSEAVENCPVSVVITDADGRIEYINPHFSELTGFSLHQAVGKTPRVLKSGKTPRSVYEDMWKTIKQGATWSGELLNRKQDGELFWEQASIAPIKDESGQITHFVATKEDITERKQAEQERKRLLDALEEQNQSLASERMLLRTIVDSMPLWLFWKDLNSNYLGCNKAYAEAVGLPDAETIKGLTDHDLDWSHQQTELCRERDRQVMSGGVEIINAEESQIGPDGTQRVLLTCKTPLLNERGEVVGMVGSFADVTDRKVAEAERDRLNVELQAAARQAGMAEVATDVLHNVGNVLNSVNVTAGVMTNQIEQSPVAHLTKACDIIDHHEHELGEFLTRDPRGKCFPAFIKELSSQLVAQRETIREELQELTANIEHIKEIISVQQSFARTRNHRELVCANQLVEDAIKMLGGNLERHGIEIQRQFHVPTEVFLPRHTVLQILINLIKNSKQAFDSVDQVCKRVTLTTQQEDGFVHFTVKDNGVGISAERQKKVFQHGFTTKSDGHGFGLHSGANAAQELGGSLTVYSQGEGHGATFTLSLPCERTTDCDQATNDACKLQTETGRCNAQVT